MSGFSPTRSCTVTEVVVPMRRAMASRLPSGDTEICWNSLSRSRPRVTSSGTRLSAAAAGWAPPSPQTSAAVVKTTAKATAGVVRRLDMHGLPVGPKLPRRSSPGTDPAGVGGGALQSGSVYRFRFTLMSTPASHLPSTEAIHERSPLRFVTAASLFDGHDAAINIMRRLIQAQGVEVVHLGHNRSVEDVVRAALQEDADGIALSSYQGGHTEYFKYMVDMLRERGAGHIRVFGGGGGTITPEEISELQDYGVERIYHPNDGMQMGLVAMIEDLVARTMKHRSRTVGAASAAIGVNKDDEISVGKVLTAIEEGQFEESELITLRKQWQLAAGKTPVIGLTGTGGAGKSSVTDELMNRFLQSFPEMRIAVISVDPTRRRTGGALLGDRIRMNSLRSPRIFMRSRATRRQHVATNAVLKDCIAFLKGQGYDLVMVETAGIGQSDSEIVDLVDFPVYVMTSDFGAPSQLEKIDMLDFAELVVLNKYDKRGAEDALRDVRKQWKRNRGAFQMKDEDVPVYPTIASQFNDPAVTWMFTNLCRLMRAKLVGATSVAID